jgi:ubiquinone/menaquinone biosynthesis C-methylase UbiE
MTKETSQAIKQKDAPKNYGTHFIDNLPYREYHRALKYFFESLPKKQETINILDAACGNEKRVMKGMESFGKPIKLTSVDLVLPTDLAETPPNVTRNILQSDLRQTWPFPDNYFDGVIFMWGIHWFGLEDSQNALDNLARVLKTGASSIICTLTPFDILLKQDAFYRDNKISKKELKKIYPQAIIVRGHEDKKPIWVVINDKETVEQLKQNEGKYYLKRENPLSIMGEKSLIGFMPNYFKEELKKRGLEIIMEVVKPNKDYPNKYPATLSKGRTQLIYVVRKTS